MATLVGTYSYRNHVFAQALVLDNMTAPLPDSPRLHTLILEHQGAVPYRTTDVIRHAHLGDDILLARSAAKAWVEQQVVGGNLTGVERYELQVLGFN